MEKVQDIFKRPWHGVVLIQTPYFETQKESLGYLVSEYLNSFSSTIKNLSVIMYVSLEPEEQSGVKTFFI